MSENEDLARLGSDPCMAEARRVAEARRNGAAPSALDDSELARWRADNPYEPGPPAPVRTVDELTPARAPSGSREPVPRPNVQGADWPELGAEAFHGPAGAAVRGLVPTTEADPVGLLLALLAMFGAAVGPVPCAAADAAEHPARLNVVLVGRTAGGRKGTAVANVKRLMAHVDSDFVGSRIMSGLASGEGLIATVRDRADDGGGDDKRLLVFEPEFSKPLKVCAREGSTLSDTIRQAWDDGNLRVMTRRDPLRATDAHISILGNITPEDLRRHLSQTEAADGFGNRFLFAVVRRSQRLAEGGGLEDDELRALAKPIAEALETARGIKRRVRRAIDAQALWKEIYDAIDDEVPGMVGAMTARADAQMLRLSVVYALLDSSAMIGVDHLRAARAVWDYCEASIRLIFADLVGDPVADELLAGLRKAGSKGLDGQAQHTLFSGHVRAAELSLARNALENRGLITTVRQQETGGRPRIVSYIAEKASKAS